MDNQQGPTHSTGDSVHCHVAAGMGGEFGENGHMHMYG